MKDVSRRDAVRLAAGLSLGVVATAPILGQESNQVESLKPEDTLLKRADSLVDLRLMLAEQVVFQTDGETLDLWITSAHAQRDGGKEVRVRLGTMRVIRPNTKVDDFTKKGGVYWKCGKVEGKFQFRTLLRVRWLWWFAIWKAR